MKWSIEKPSKPGFYWCRNDTKFPVVVQVSRAYKNGLVVRMGSYLTSLQRFENCEWAGPISPPEE